MNNKITTHKRPSLGPLEKPPKPRFELSPNTKVLIRHIAIGVAVLGSVALLLTGIWHGTRLPSLTITSVTASGGETIDAGEVVAKAQQVLEGTYGKIIPRRFSWFYPQSELLAEVEKVERIRDVVIERVSNTELAITYNEHMPFALWCSHENEEACVFLNERGYAFAHAPQLDGGSFIRYHDASTEPEIGREVMNFEQFWNTVSFSELLASDGLFIESVEIDAVGDAYYGLTTGGQLRATLADPATTIAGNLHTILASKEFTHLRDKDFNYIDLRFGSKVYVSEVDVAALAAASTTATSTDDFFSASAVASDTQTVLSTSARER